MRRVMRPSGGARAPRLGPLDLRSNLARRGALALVLGDKLLQVARRLLGALLNVRAEALEQGLDNHIPDVDEGGGDPKGQDDDDGDGEDGGVRDRVEVPPLDDERTDEPRHDCDEELAEHIEDGGHGGEGAYAEAVADEKHHRVLGRGAEGRSYEGRLDVGVAVDELEEALEAGEAALADAREALYDLAVGIQLGELVHVVAEHPPDHLHNGNDQGPGRGGARVVPEGPDKAVEDGEAEHLLVADDEPLAGGAGDGEVADGEDEGADPKEPEEVEDEAPADGVVPRVGVRGLVPAACRREVEEDDDEPDKEDNDEEPRDQGEEEGRGDLGKARGSLLDDLAGEVDAGSHVAEEDRVDAQAHPKDDAAHNHQVLGRRAPPERGALGDLDAGDDAVELQGDLGLVDVAGLDGEDGSGAREQHPDGEADAKGEGHGGHAEDLGVEEGDAEGDGGAREDDELVLVDLIGEVGESVLGAADGGGDAAGGGAELVVGDGSGLVGAVEGAEARVQGGGGVDRGAVDVRLARHLRAGVREAAGEVLCLEGGDGDVAEAVLAPQGDAKEVLRGVGGGRRDVARLRAELVGAVAARLVVAGAAHRHALHAVLPVPKGRLVVEAIGRRGLGRLHQRRGEHRADAELPEVGARVLLPAARHDAPALGLDLEGLHALVGDAAELVGALLDADGPGEVNVGGGGGGKAEVGRAGVRGEGVGVVEILLARVGAVPAHVAVEVVPVVEPCGVPVGEADGPDGDHAADEDDEDHEHQAVGAPALVVREHGELALRQGLAPILLDLVLKLRLVFLRLLLGRRAAHPRLLSRRSQSQ
mmetsp:Transcript_23355/g.58568  ORF Transcript_23355/g.58568 Transcript_23355/m.58568 type:complete len:818 (-) Transcript_23355:119-2572(-)